MEIFSWIKVRSEVGTSMEIHAANAGLPLGRGWASNRLSSLEGTAGHDSTEPNGLRVGEVGQASPGQPKHAQPRGGHGSCIRLAQFEG